MRVKEHNWRLTSVSVCGVCVNGYERACAHVCVCVCVCVSGCTIENASKSE